MVDCKQCCQCGEIKDITEFYKSKKYKDGFLCSCKNCNKIKAKEWRDNNLEYAKEHRRKRYRENSEQEIRDSKEWQGKNKDKVKESKKKWKLKNKDKHQEHAKRHRDKHPEKVSARKKAWAAIKSGKLKKLPCSSCGEKKTEAHHDDYLKPLDVRWLCVRCHSTLHHHQT